MASTACGPWITAHGPYATVCGPWAIEAPFGLNPMRPKGAKGPDHQLPRLRWVHLSHIWSQNGHKRPSGPKMAKNSMDTIFQSMASDNHQRAPTQLPERFLLTLKGRFLFPQCTPYSRFHKWCIYGIIYYYAPFLLSNPIMNFSGPN
ncbi:hypothetical protein O181_127588 [Austropuccinia psidii MF-1]|uniref:Uncharacterized protein n=1 Tax=Austropuccinia psidii MF-1 TaxID=1389203 RepID=A0A9Q3KUP2_9BASI|nr:hypothetical protein [Austropuccinia psidii MF-1]